ncbi:MULTISPECIES: 4-hydroxy-3-methylbut-2-enyl diphosphate reductase [Mammaliicoccus]|uniref:4-hydroxy-3-methylbut-2-enyl diphosphate reductase n=1 Tax=Mammaliicoccus vitulinus TaxID=71237 RepID=A0A2T4PRG8_9STAP|nr:MULTISPECIES: 4-hydroxy-3-methylbut-2-enyl diphosphate reductase [Mammaliicoccus]MBM6628205.1 4-hydroxy-3-methylbut-2-enyl diphosphate reductase [Mammaliicoccus vitulinus]MBO3077229.1 4-hydroxy-3-methylbut-2-enyl diphosphate reductase [Mammaliicoccus vitulinus]MEB7656897.1 4-hydroxy-3-methylbut-2-enyl diphosphate reductase [Mammaliicoccus vitulinus]PNZ36879.1 4-hydroxy-3-methylbut-2-enyl diphosphate reductase [Mammaliicoccus vitulinus]PTI28704.1 4-hydroxy-3-methylbut-2-enyl diphosphate redu
MEIIKITPRGYCYGVVDAMVIARNASLDKSLPRPIYILGMIVHNKHVTDAFESDGIITLDGPNRLKILEQIDEGTVIFTAHGVSPEVKKRAKEKGLVCIDATCPDVDNTHQLIREVKEKGYNVIYIGKKGHPEPEGAVGVAPDIVHLVQTLDDIEALPEHIKDKKLIVTNQTTMSQWDVKHLIDELKIKYPHIEVHEEICLATQVRQEAVANQAQQADLLIVVGDPKSNNSNRLAQVSKEIAHTNAYRISDLSELKLEWLQDVESVAVTAGASTPTLIVKEVIDYIKNYDPTNVPDSALTSNVPIEKILPKIKKPQPVKIMK